MHEHTLARTHLHTHTDTHMHALTWEREWESEWAGQPCFQRQGIGSAKGRAESRWQRVGRLPATPEQSVQAFTSKKRA